MVTEQDAVLIRYFGKRDGQETYETTYVNEWSESQRHHLSYGPSYFMDVTAELVRHMQDKNRLNTTYELKVYDEETRRELDKDQKAILEGIIALHNKIASARDLLSS